MNRHDEIQNAYKYLGKEATFYDGMITCSTIAGKAVCGLVWNMDKEANTKYLEMAMAGIPEGFSGKLLEVPVGTGVLTMPLYKTLPDAHITCLDYSADMMASAQHRAETMGCRMFTFSRAMLVRCPMRTIASILYCPSFPQCMLLLFAAYPLVYTFVLT